MTNKNMIAVSHLTKRLSGQLVLEDINLSVAEGELLVILGESGAGKSVLLQHLIGLMKPDKGTITIDGQEITTLSEQQLLQVRKKIGYLFQEGALYDFMNIYENVAFPLEEHTRLEEEQIHQKVKNVLETVGLSSVEEKFPSELSGGMKKRAALARAVVLDSKILFCDEPTSGLDPILSRDISNLISHIARQLNCTTVVTSHDIVNSLRIADRLALVHQGKLVAVGTEPQLKSSQDPFVQEFIG